MYNDTYQWLLPIGAAVMGNNTCHVSTDCYVVVF